MIDLKLDRSSHDLVRSNEDLELVDGSGQVAQRLKIRLLAYLGEWFLDTAVGTPYFERILGTLFRPQVSSDVIRRRILDTEGVVRLVDFNYERVNRQLSISAQVQLSTGETTTVTITP